MTALLLLASFLALASGLLQTFGKGRTPGTIRVVALVELLTGLATPFLAIRRSLSPGAASGVLIFVLGLVLYSSLSRTLRTRARNKHREETEGARLVTYVKYLSNPEVGGQEPPSQGEGEP